MYCLKLYDLHRSFVMRWGMILNLYCTTLHFIGYFITEYFKESLSLKSNCSGEFPGDPVVRTWRFHKGPGTPAGGTKILQACGLETAPPHCHTPPNKEELFTSQLS